MAAGEDQTQAFVGNVGGVEIGFVRVRSFRGLVQFHFLGEIRSTPNPVDGFVPRGLDEPCSGIFRNAIGSPLVYRCRKSLLRHVFCKVEIAVDPDQRRNDPAPIRAVHCFDGEVGIQEHTERIKCFFIECRFDRPPFD